MSAPFPVAAQDAAQPAVRLIPERKEFVPAWCPWASGQFKNPEATVVTQGGAQVEPGFTVAEMLPERRWAVKADGELLAPLEFQELYQRKLRDWFYQASPEGRQGRGRVPSSFAVHREPVPDARVYAAVQLNARDASKIQLMGYDPESTKGATAKRLWDSDGERFIEGHERMRVLIRAYREEEDGGRPVLRPHEREEVERYLGNRASDGAGGRDEVRVRMEQLTQLRQEGALTDTAYANQVAKLLAIPEEGSDQPKPLHRMGHSLMVCGSSIPNARRRQHIESCQTCQMSKSPVVPKPESEPSDKAE